MSDAIGAFGPLLETRLRVATWNLWWQFGPWEARRRVIAATLAGLDADILALQEVWGMTGRTLAGELADELGYDHADAWRLEHGGVTFGNAILSRWPITRSDWHPLPAPPDAEEFRTVLLAEVEGPRGRIQVFCTHLNWRFDQSHVRQEQVRAVADFIAHVGPRRFPPILCGDLNAAPDAEEIRMLTGRTRTPVPKLVFHDAWEVAGSGPGWTWSNDNGYAVLDLEPNRRIDYVLVGWPKPGGAGHVTSCRLVGTEPLDGILASDHFGVVAEVRY